MQGASSWDIGRREYVILESWLNFVCDCFRTIMYFHKKMKMTPYPFNIIFDEIIYSFCISEQNNRDWLENMCNFKYFKIWNQEFSCPD